MMHVAQLEPPFQLPWLVLQLFLLNELGHFQEESDPSSAPLTGTHVQMWTELDFGLLFALF